MTQQVPEKPLPLSRWLSRRRQQLSARLYVLHERSRRVAEQLELDGMDVDPATAAGTSELLKRLLSAERQMRQMLVDHPAAVLVVDQQGHVQLSNNAVRDLLETMGLSQADLYIGQSVENLFPGILSAAQIELPADRERCDAGHLVMVVRRTPVVWGKGPATLILLHDVTPEVDARRQLEQAVARLQDVNRLKSEFITMASHEFRTPLTSVLSSLELLEEYLKRSGMSLPLDVIGRMQRHLSRSKDAVQHLDRMVEDMLILEKTHAGRVQFRPESVCMVTLVRDVFGTLESICEQQAVQLTLQGPDTMTVQADSRLLRHVITNLLTNAVNFSPPGGQVTLILTQTDEQLCIEVEDQGPGIPAPDQTRIFEAFYRGENGKAAPGSGLGLNIVQRFVDLHGGLIDLDSEPGSGTVFRITLPLSAAHE